MIVDAKMDIHLFGLSYSTSETIGNLKAQLTHYY